MSETNPNPPAGSAGESAEPAPPVASTTPENPSTPAAETPLSEEVQRYLAFHKSVQELSSDLFNRISRETFQAALKRLGIQSVDSNEDYFEVAACMDFALFQVRVAGESHLDRLLKTETLEPGSPRATAANALRQSRYTIFQVESKTESTLDASDILRSEKLKIFDRMLPKQEGFDLFGARLIPWEDNWTLHGSTIPMRANAVLGLIQALTPILTRNISSKIHRLTPEKQSDVVAMIQRRGLEDVRLVKLGV